MKNLLKKYFAKKDKKLINFENLLYIQKNGEFENDSLFRISANELNLQFNYKHQISYLTIGNENHIFFTHIKNLSGLGVAYPEPLIFGTLYQEKLIQQNNFAVIVFDKNVSYICFFENGQFKTLRALPHFALKDLALREDREEFFKTMLAGDGRIFRLLKAYNSEILLSLNDDFCFGKFFGEKKFCPHLKIEDIFEDEKDKYVQKLCRFGLKYFDERVNFIKKNEINLELFKITFMPFLLCFFGILIILFFEDYPQYAHNQIIKKNNQKIIEDLNKIDEELLILNENLKKLNKTYENNKLLLENHENILHNLIAHLQPNKMESHKLYNILKFLNKNSLTISFLSLKNNQIKIIFNTEMDYNKALQNMKKQNKFKILNDDIKELVLEFSYG